MAEQDTLPRIKKYLFDQHNFDDDHVEEPEEELPPPPPVYSQEELSAARDHSFAEGKKEGLTEAAASREKHVADILNTISQNFSTLFSAEAQRNALYENESVHLAQTIFDKLFPYLNETRGLDEIKHVIMSVLEQNREQAAIKIETHPDYVTDIQEAIDKSLQQATAGLATVEGNPALGPGDCRLEWKNGGGARNATELSGQIAKLLEETLADKPRLRDNGEKESITEEPSPDTDTGPVETESKE